MANMTRKSKGAGYTTSIVSAGLSTAHAASGQTNVEEADSESSMPCSLPDDVANQYARYVDCLLLSILVTIYLLCSVDTVGTVTDPAAATAAT